MKKFKDDKRGYLLGIDNCGHEVYLKEPSWDCNWYYGFGYLEIVDNYGSGHYHFDSLFFEYRTSYIDTFRNFFDKTPLSENEWWELLEMMKCFYTYREMSDMCHRGGSNITSSGNEKDDDIYNIINKEKLPNLFARIDKLLSPQVREMTIGEIEEELGYSIKIVKEEK